LNKHESPESSTRGREGIFKIANRSMAPFT
jgi:hypothetical protein